jgi:hypothetical protein
LLTTDPEVCVSWLLIYQVSQDEVGNLIAVLPGAVADAVLVSTHMHTVGADIGIQPIIATGLSAPTDRRFSGRRQVGHCQFLELLRLLLLLAHQPR